MMETWLILGKEFTCRFLSIQSSESRGNDGKLILHNLRATMPQDRLMSHFPSKIRWTRPFPMPSKPTKHFGETQWPSKNHFLRPFDRGPTVCFTSGGVLSPASNVDLRKPIWFKMPPSDLNNCELHLVWNWRNQIESCNGFLSYAHRHPAKPLSWSRILTQTWIVFPSCQNLWTSCSNALQGIGTVRATAIDPNDLRKGHWQNA